MQSQSFKDKEILESTPDMEGVTRPKKDKKTKKFTFIIKGVGVGLAPMKLSTSAETEAKAIKYIKARWKDCSYKLV